MDSNHRTLSRPDLQSGAINHSTTCPYACSLKHMTYYNGYSQVRSFYSPDYSLLPKDEDYRRTLYWNPNVKTDSDGKVTIEFYNNSSCKNIDISAETLTKEGGLGAITK